MTTISKIDIDKFVEHLVKYGALNVNAVQSALYAQGLTLCGDTIQRIKEETPKFKIGQRIKQGDTIAEIKEISEDGYHCDIAFVPFTAEENWKLSLWSEEDDKLLYECKKEMWKSAPTMLSLKHEKIEKWLESLKQRLQ